MSAIEIQGLDDFEKLLQEGLVLDTSTKRRAVKNGIKVIAENLEKDTPPGPTGKLAEIKTTVREKDLAIEGLARSKAFYDIFQEFGTSEQKKHVGYFERSVNKNSKEAVEEVAKVIFSKMR